MKVRNINYVQGGTTDFLVILSDSVKLVVNMDKIISIAAHPEKESIEIRCDGCEQIILDDTPLSYLLDVIENCGSIDPLDLGEDCSTCIN